MKKVAIDLGKDIDNVIIFPLGDLHLGDKLCRLDLIKKQIDVIANTDNAYVILTGDILNNNIKSAVGSRTDENMSPAEQLIYAAELLQPIKHKILAMVSGNHENRTTKEVHQDLLFFLARELQIVDRYDPVGVVLFLTFGVSTNRKDRSKTFTAYITHGAGGGGTAGAKINRLMNLRNVVDVDLYFHAHTHQAFVTKTMRIRTCTRTKTIREVTQLLINNNAWLDYGGYGEVKGYSPVSKNPPYVVLFQNGEMKGVL